MTGSIQIRGEKAVGASGIDSLCRHIRLRLLGYNPHGEREEELLECRSRCCGSVGSSINGEPMDGPREEWGSPPVRALRLVSLSAPGCSLGLVHAIRGRCGKPSLRRGVSQSPRKRMSGAPSSLFFSRRRKNVDAVLGALAFLDVLFS